MKNVRHQIAKDRKEEEVHPLWSGFIQASGFFGENEKAFFFHDSRLYWFLDLFARVEKGKKAVLYTYSSSALLCVSYIESRSMMVVFTARGVFRKQQMDGNDYLDGNALSMLEWKQTQKFIPYSAFYVCSWKPHKIQCKEL